MGLMLNYLLPFYNLPVSGLVDSKTKKCISKLLFTESLGFLPYTNHCVYVMVTTSCLGDSLKNTRLRCDKPFLWTIIRCHAMKTSCIIATEHKYELNSVHLTSRILNYGLNYSWNGFQKLLVYSLMQIWLWEIFANLKNMCKPMHTS